MNIIPILREAVAKAAAELYSAELSADSVQVSPTPAEFNGDYSVVVFPIVKTSKKAPEATAQELGQWLSDRVPVVQGFNVIKGFLNLEVSVAYWQTFLDQALADPHFGRRPRNGRKVMVEFSSPNTNKPLHLGHIRNILLGWSSSRLLDAAGYDVYKVQIINDRGVAICKSMLSWLKTGQGQTPASAGIKGDHFVGDYYVSFEKLVKAEYDAWQQTDAGQRLFAEKAKANQTEKDFFKDYKNKWFNDHSTLGAEVREMLLKWEAGDPDTIALWKQMNGWVYEGFDQTYANLGVSFDKLYFESDTYLLGKAIVDDGLARGAFYRKDDGSVWVDLTDAGHDHKVLLRADGTSVYITQDLGTARMRYQDFGCEKMVYVVADEQNYHFAVLFETLKRLGEPYADGLYHLSYGLVELPTGRMKTREGTVVDADDLIAEVMRIAREQATERGELDALPADEQQAMLRAVALGALKFFILKVHPKKKMIFNPEESVDLQGQTGPYIQYSYVRINSLMARVAREQIGTDGWKAYTDFQAPEKELLKALHEFPAVVLQAAEDYDPSHVANYCYNLAKSYHRFWHDLSVFNAETDIARAFRLQLSAAVGKALQTGMHLLGVDMPNRM